MPTSLPGAQHLCCKVVSCRMKGWLLRFMALKMSDIAKVASPETVDSPVSAGNVESSCAELQLLSSCIHSFVLLYPGTRHQSFSWTSSHRRSQWTQARTSKRTKPPNLWKVDHQFHDDFQLGISVFRFWFRYLQVVRMQAATQMLHYLCTLTYMLFCRLDKFRVCVGPRVQSLFSRHSQALLMMLDVLLGLPFQVRVGIRKGYFHLVRKLKDFDHLNPLLFAFPYLFHTPSANLILKSKSVQLFCILPIIFQRG